MDVLHDYIFSGGLKKGGTWGGPECASAVPFEIHVKESVAWTIFIAAIASVFNLSAQFKQLILAGEKSITGYKPSFAWRALDTLFTTIHLAMWVQVLCYKIYLHSLVNLLQPCHLALLALGVSFLLRGPSGAVLSIIVMPMSLLGAISAIAFPATEGLDLFYEKESFFIQHYLLLITPLYHLLRNNYCGLKIFGLRALLLANWASIVLHWIFFEVRLNLRRRPLSTSLYYAVSNPEPPAILLFLCAAFRLLFYCQCEFFPLPWRSDGRVFQGRSLVALVPFVQNKLGHCPLYLILPRLLPLLFRWALDSNYSSSDWRLQ